MLCEGKGEKHTQRKEKETILLCLFEQQSILNKYAN